MTIEKPGKYSTRNNRMVIIDRIKVEDIPRFDSGKPIVVQEKRAYGRLFTPGQTEGGELNFWRAETGGFGPTDGVGHNYDIVSMIAA